MSNQTPSESELQRVALDNIRDNQIGGKTDGISPEVAKDLGFTVDPEGVRQIVEDRERAQQVESADIAIQGLHKATNKPTSEEAPLYGLPKSKDRIERRKQL